MREYMDNRVRILDWTSRGSSVTPAHSCHRGLFARIRIRNSFRLTAKPAPDAGGTTSNLKAVGSNPIRRASGGSSEVEHQAVRFSGRDVSADPSPDGCIS